uniref:Uncharacterized protein n=1 Tax=Arundo donax TaxID=35708 RepID=A0A0A8YB38_ARUDO
MIQVTSAAPLTTTTTTKP